MKVPVVMMTLRAEKLILLHQQIGDVGLLQRKIRKVFQKSLEAELISLLVALCPGCSDAWPL